ncbi:unnamed protein product [Blepharisma stoltei]|uniref:Uncharacterized protein n=1 Tax=Blepharisma stoltei TaxID=1481888 RepID=A0AAU9JH32_9CILI|nr:unnamed protein product [Blepharisma stoltei]
MEDQTLSYLGSTINQDQSGDFFDSPSEDKGNELLIMTIDIGDGRTDELTVYENDKPEWIAEQFCLRHNMSSDVKELLIQQIKMNIEIIYQEQAQSMTFNKENDFINNEPEFMQNDRSLTPIEKSYSPESNEYLRKFSDENSFERPNSSKISQKPLEFSQITTNQSQLLNNSGEKLYYKGLLLKEQTEKKIQTIKKQKNEEMMKELTFHPKTNTKSPQRRMPEIDLLKKGKEKNEHIEKKRGEFLAEEMSHCTFSPSVDKRSSSLVKNKKRNESPDRCVALYENAKVIEDKKAILYQRIQQQDCPFNPDTSLTNKMNKQLIRSVPERLAYSRRTIEEYIMKTKYIDIKDFSTGQQLFHPKTGRSPAKRDANPSNIGEHLYSISKKSPTKDRIQSQSPTRHTNQTSYKIIERIKFQRYKELFDMMNPQDGKISKETIESGYIPRNIKDIIDPLINELGDLNETLTYEEFFEAMELLMKELNPTEKSVLLNTKKSSHQEESKYTFRPSINNSFSKESSKESSRESIYERNMKRMMEIQEKVKTVRTHREIAEMDECTFKPKLNKGNLTKDSLNFSNTDLVLKDII